MRTPPKVGERGYERLAFEDYRTPAWVTDLLLAHFELRGTVWEPACGGNDMVMAIRAHGYKVRASDIRGTPPEDFLGHLTTGQKLVFGSVVTNPPFAAAQEFIERALEVTEAQRGMVAMLLAFPYDTAIKTRGHLFKHLAFDAKMPLGRRVQWVGFGDKATARENHAWFVWDWARAPGPARIIYP